MIDTRLAPSECSLLIDPLVRRVLCNLVVNLCSPAPRHRLNVEELWEPDDLGQVLPGIRLHPPISVMNTRY